MDDQRIIALSPEKLAGVATGQAQTERAARLLGAAQALREAIHVPVESIDRPDIDLPGLQDLASLYGYLADGPASII